VLKGAKTTSKGVLLSPDVVTGLKLSIVIQ